MTVNKWAERPIIFDTDIHYTTTTYYPRRFASIMKNWEH